MKYLLLFIVCFAMSVAAYGQTGSLEGTVTDADNGEPLIFGIVALLKNGQVVTGTETDVDGFYSITSIDPGVYEVEFSYTGYSFQSVTGVPIEAGKTLKLNSKITAGASCFPISITICTPIIDLGDTTQDMNFSSWDIKHIPVIRN